MRLSSKMGSLVLSMLAIVAGCGDDTGDDGAAAGGGGRSGSAGAGAKGGTGGSGAKGGAGGSGAKGGTGAKGGSGGSPAAGEGGDAGDAGEPGAGEGGVGGEGGAGEGGMGGAGSDLPGDTFVVTSQNRLISFDRAAPFAVTSAVTLSGLADGETILGVDFRPFDGELYALGASGRIYTLSLDSGEATEVAVLSAAMGDATDPFTGLGEGSYGVDFNPAADLLRVVSSSGLNLRIVPSARSIGGVMQVAGATFTDGALNPGTPAVEAAAYDDNFDRTCRTRLFVLDAASDKLYLQNPPNDGVLVERGGLGIDASAVSGFDIVTDTSAEPTDVGVAIVSVDTETRLVEIDLEDGSASQISALSLREGETVVGMAVMTPDPAAAPRQAQGELLAITESNRLISFNRGTPRSYCTSSAVSGLGGANVVGIDVRPATGALYAVTDDDKLYVVDPATGVATLEGAFDNALAGDSFAVGFNPVADRLRIIGNAGQNLRVVPTPAAGVVTAIVDGATSEVGISAVAYSNSFPTAKATTLFGIDTLNDRLVRVGADPGSSSASCPEPSTPASAGNPNCGVVTSIRTLGLSGDVTDVNGFDIEAATGAALAAVTIGNATSSTLVSLGLGADGATTLLGTIGGGERLRGLAFAADRPVTAAVYAVAADNLLRFAPTAPASVVAVPITGLSSEETVLAIDFRPATGALYALGSMGRLYTLDLATGAASFVAALEADPADVTAPFVGLTLGASVGLDFNPMVDRLRLISDDEQNLRIVPTTALTTTDTSLTPAGSVSAAAYTNAFAVAPSTQLFVIDAATDQLLLQGNPSPNDGVLNVVGALGVDATGDVAFDIAGVPNATFSNAFALAAFTPSGGQPSLYTVNLTTGAASPYNASAPNVIGTGEPIRGIAIDLD